MTTTDASGLDIEIAEAFEACPPPRVGFGDVDRARRAWREYVAALSASTSAPADVDVTDEIATEPTTGRTVAVRVYRSAAPAEAAGLLYFHGGAFTIGDLDMEDVLSRRLSGSAGCTVVSVDYRLVPEHTFPAQLEDAATAFDWAVENAQSLGIAEDRLAVGGCSAGATIAASLAQLLRKRTSPRPSAQILLSPVLDAELATASMLAAPVGVRRHLRNMWSAYLGTAGRETEFSSPAALADLADLPPAYVAVGALDELRDEARLYADRLRDSGVPALFRMWPAAPHAFELFAPDATVSRRSTEEIARVIARGLDGLEP